MSKRKSPLISAEELLQRPPRPEPATAPSEGTPTAQGEPTATPADSLQKATVPFRASQLRRLSRALARWEADSGVRAAAAEVIRLALDDVLADLEADPAAVLERLQQQKAAEERAGIARKYGRLKVE